MHKHRLQRLASLTRGVALVGIGATALACHKDPQGMNGPEPVFTNGPEPIHTNAPPLPTDAGANEPIGAPTASASGSVSPRSMNGPAPVAKPSASHTSTPPRSTP